jgi:hypothetical protein
MFNDYEWEYSPLARVGNWFWTKVIDPILCAVADDGYPATRTAANAGLAAGRCPAPAGTPTG